MLGHRGVARWRFANDTPPDLRTQLLREQIGVAHAVLFTHEHADHLFGLDDLRLFPFYLGHPSSALLRGNCRKSHPNGLRLRLFEAETDSPGGSPSV